VTAGTRSGRRAMCSITPFSWCGMAHRGRRPFSKCLILEPYVSDLIGIPNASDARRGRSNFLVPGVRGTRDGEPASRQSGGVALDEARRPRPTVCSAR
jgi:hypothetical protein